MFAGRGELPCNKGKWCEVTNIGAMPENAGRPLTATWIELDDATSPSQDIYFIYINSMFKSNASRTLNDDVSLPLIGAGLPPVRKVHYSARLREFREHLYTALQCLADGGTLCMAWSGPPCHPILFFLAAQLRPCFKRVHIVTPSDSVSLEIYILGMHFRRGTGEQDLEDYPYAVFQSFLATSQRSSGCDDVLCWCPTHATLMDEFQLGKADYENMFYQFANKVKSVSEEIAASSKRSKKQEARPPSEGLYARTVNAALQELQSQGTKLPRIPMGSR